MRIVRFSHQRKLHRRSAMKRLCNEVFCSPSKPNNIINHCFLSFAFLIIRGHLDNRVLYAGNNELTNLKLAQ